MTTKTQPEETEACCCVDFGTVIDNTECTVTYNHDFSSEEEARQMLDKLTKKARSIESDPCQISDTIETNGGSTHLKANFVFACATERMIFQLALR